MSHAFETSTLLNKSLTSLSEDEINSLSEVVDELFTWLVDYAIVFSLFLSDHDIIF